MKSCHYVRVSCVQNIFDFALCLLPSTGGNILICEILWKNGNVVHFFLNCGRIFRSIGHIRSGSCGNRIWCDRLQDCGSVMPNECSNVIFFTPPYCPCLVCTSAMSLLLAKTWCSCWFRLTCQGHQRAESCIRKFVLWCLSRLRW